jgi:hypothetical protein
MLLQGLIPCHLSVLSFLILTLTLNRSLVMQDFIRTLVNLTYCSTEYAMGMWNGLSDMGLSEEDRKVGGEQAAKDFVKKHKLSTKSYDLGEVD